MHNTMQTAEKRATLTSLENKKTIQTSSMDFRAVSPSHAPDSHLPPGSSPSEIQQDGHLLLLGKPHSPPEHGKGELGQGLGIVLGVFRDVRLAVLPAWAYGTVHRVTPAVDPAEDGVLVGLPCQLIQLLQLLPQPAQGGDHSQVVRGQRGLKEEGVRQRQPPGSVMLIFKSNS